MKRNSFIAGASFVALSVILPSCGHSTNEVVALVTERDSLLAQNELYEKRLDRIDQMVNTFGSVLDSIAMEEGMIFISDVEGTPINRDDALKNVERFATVLRNQAQRINDLEQQLARTDSPYDDPIQDASVKALINNMREQLAQKDAQIEYLKRELAKKDVDIAQLQRKVESQAQTIENLGNQNARQRRALTTQDEIMNTCYTLIGDKKFLESRGVIKKKKLVNNSALDKSKFRAIDIRKCRELTFEAKRPRILTNMPEAAYELTTSGNGQFTLRITNPAAFWSISNFLVIQTD